ncbi:MAG: DUF4402 domain-containing protein [Alphaproteobacteria bacterium]|nr:DUF4402 domain-containing protein [Alphaproteobacteria bacterium]
MKNSIRKVALSSATVIAAGALGSAANAATASVAIQAIVLDPVQITANNSLNFGSVTESGAGGTIVVDNGGFNSVTGAVTSIGGTIQPGTFTLKGSTGRNIQVDVANVATISSGANTMTVNALVLYNPAGTITGDPITVTLGAATVAGFELGGTLNVGAGQAAGTYTGNVAVTAAYN